MDIRGQLYPAAVVAAVAAAALPWPLGGGVALAVLGVGAAAAAALPRTDWAEAQPRVLAGLVWALLPPLVGGALSAFRDAEVAARQSGALALALAAGVPVAVAAAPGPQRWRTFEWQVALAVAAPSTWVVQALADPRGRWSLLWGLLPFALTAAMGARAILRAERRRASVRAALLSRARHVAGGALGDPPSVFGLDGGARAVLEELDRARAAVLAGQAQISRTGQQLEDSTGIIAGALTVHRESARAWSEALEAFRAASDQMRSSAAQIGGNLGEVAKMALTADLAAKQDERGAAAFFASMEELTLHSQQVADAVRSLNLRVQRVGVIIQAITGIADRADLLAVNAELEANRAGDVEKAFALLAAEMRRMAEQVIHSAQSIARDIDEVVRISTAAASAANAAVVATHDSTRQGRALTERLVELLEASRRTAEAVEEIRAAVADQQQQSARLADRAALLIRTTSEGEGAARHLASTTGDLQMLVRRLAISAQQGPPPRPGAREGGP
jgi:methyl-accepting chemotaxis protein